MKWKLIFSLSLFGLAMAFATISLIPEKIEPVFWLVIFIICAYVIAKRAGGSYFLHGFMVSIINCIWITGAHVYFYATYVANHVSAAEMSKNFPPYFQQHPHRAMLIMGPFFGIAFGLILGLFSFIASKLVKKGE